MDMHRRKTAVEQILSNGIKSIKKKREMKGLMRKTNPITNRPNVIMEHQKNAIVSFEEFMKNDSTYIYNHAMGAGKTVSSILSFSLMCLKQYNVGRCVIVAPTSTLRQWKESILNWTVMKEEDILVCRSSVELTSEKIENIKFLIITQTCLDNAFKSCYQKYDDYEIIYSVKYPDRIQRYKSAWKRKGMEFIKKGLYHRTVGADKRNPLHPIFREHMMIVYDEIHEKRNSETIGCNSCNILSKYSDCVLGLTGTLLCNKPSDLFGISKAMRFSENANLKKLQDKTLAENIKGIDFFRKYTHRVSEHELKLPPIKSHAVNFELGITNNITMYNALYNSILEECKRIKKRIESNYSDTKNSDMLKFISNIQKLQMFVVAPDIAVHGCKAFYSDSALYEEAVSEQKITGCMRAFFTEMSRMQDNGHKRIVVACANVVPMLVLKRYLEVWHNGVFGRFFVFSGAIDEIERHNVKKSFLTADKSVLFLSMKAGGVGLDLIPGCESMIIVGPLPFSPASLLQCTRRIYRVGQTCPTTKQVTVVYLVAANSIDYGIGGLHKYKRKYLDFAQDGLSIETDGDRKFEKLRIIDNAEPLQIDSTGGLTFPAIKVTTEVLPDVFYA